MGEVAPRNGVKRRRWRISPTPSHRLTAKSGVLIVADHGHIRDNASLDPTGSRRRCQRRQEGGDHRQEGRPRRKFHLRRDRSTNRPNKCLFLGMWMRSLSRETSQRRHDGLDLASHPLVLCLGAAHLLFSNTFLLPRFPISARSSSRFLPLFVSASVLCNSRVILSAKGRRRRRRRTAGRRPRAKTDHPDDGRSVGVRGDHLAPVVHPILSLFGSTVNKRWNRKEFGNVVFFRSGNGASGWARRPWEWNWAAEEPGKAGRKTDRRRTEAVRRMQAESGSPLNGVPRRRAPFAVILAPRKDGGKKGRGMLGRVRIKVHLGCMNNSGWGEPMVLPRKFAHSSITSAFSREYIYATCPCP